MSINSRSFRINFSKCSVSVFSFCYIGICSYFVHFFHIHRYPFFCFCVKHFDFFNSRRPTDGRYGQNPNRLQHYYQYQVIIKPAPSNILDLYIQSLMSLGIDPSEHDIRFVEDDWENPSIGACGLGWEVWLDGMENYEIGRASCRERV